MRFPFFAPLLVVVLTSSFAWTQPSYSSAEQAHNAGVKFINSGDLVKAREALETALQMAQTDELRLKISRTLLVPYRELTEIEPLQKTVEFILTTSANAFDRSSSRDMLLTFVHKRGKLKSVVDEYEARLKKTPQNWAILYLLAEAYSTQQKDMQRASEIVEKLDAVSKQQNKGQDVNGQAMLAQQFVKAGKFKEGAERFETVAPLDKHLEAWHWKEAAAAWLKADQRPKAIAAGKQSSAAAPEKRSGLLTYFWHRGLADVFLEAGEPKLAIPHYEQALATTKIQGYVKDTQAKLEQARTALKP